MIVIDIANSKPVGTSDKAAFKWKPTSIIPPPNPNTNDICICKCAYYEKVFSESGSIIKWWKNDKTTLMFKKQIASDTVTIKLYKNAVAQATISNNTYGLYYAYGTLPDINVCVFIADWNKIYNALGVGTYYFEITKKVLGVTLAAYNSIYYKLNKYSDSLANGTVRIETYNTGTIINAEIDYNALFAAGLYQSYRIEGKLMPKQPKVETDNYLNQDYKYLQIQDKIINEWTLITGMLPSSISNMIIYDNLLANKILISDYNAYNEEIIKEKELSLVEIPNKNGYINHYFTIKFKETLENNIKNNF